MHMYYIGMLHGGLNTLTTPGIYVMAKVLDAVPDMLSLEQTIHSILNMHMNVALLTLKGWA